MDRLQAIPTNIITGFLGVGKTTAITHLLNHKPGDERWAILVNEFGEVGIDGSLCSGDSQESQGVFVREVPGGCMCCAAGLPMQIALNMLLARAKPHRLLIEPTGLGHPKEVLATLSAEHYRPVIDLQATITLVDARKISDERYIGNTIFKQQLEVADVIVANKSDQYSHTDLPALNTYLSASDTLASKPVYTVTQGAIELAWLRAPFMAYQHADHHHHDASLQSTLPIEPEIPEGGYFCAVNQSDGFYSLGWIFDAQWLFDEMKLNALLMGIDAERIKGVFHTPNGVIAFNKADNVLSQTTLKETLDSRIELIATKAHSEPELTTALLACKIND